MPAMPASRPPRHRPAHRATARSSGWSARTKPASRRSAWSRPAWPRRRSVASSTGTLTIDGETMAGRTTHELAERVVVGFQNPNTQRSGIAATVFEEVALGPMNLGLSARRDRRSNARGDWPCSGSSRIAMRDPARLSGGQAQLVGIAVAAGDASGPRHPRRAHGPARPGRDAARRARPCASWPAAGTSLLIAEHKTDLLDGLCQRIVVLDGGRIVLSGPTADVFADPAAGADRRRAAGPGPAAPGAQHRRRR